MVQAVCPRLAPLIGRPPAPPAVAPHPACFGIGESLNGLGAASNDDTFPRRLAASDPVVVLPRRQVEGRNAFLASLPIPEGANGVAILHCNQIEQLPPHLVAAILANAGIIHLVRETGLASATLARSSESRST